jgi:tripartite-type tricarboxylate transporter receptor subunit TctC
MPVMLKGRRMLAAFGACMAIASGAGAQAWPEKPVRMIVPFPAGGPLDVAARLFAPHLGEKFGQPFLVENRPGASGTIGMEQAAKAPADGYTILWTLDSMLTVNPTVYKVEPLERLRPVTLITENPGVLAINAGVKARTVDEFVKLSRSSDFSYGSAGPGSPGHRQMELFKMLTGARLTHVPYGGNAPAIQSLVAGDTQAFITPVSGALPQIRAGKLRGLAVTAAKRSAVLPDVPTMVESGQPRFVVVAWYCVMVPAKTPQPIVDALDRELVRIIQLPNVKEVLAKAGSDPVWDTGAAVVQRAATERALWAEVIEKTGMKIE